MRKVLLATTALVALGGVSAASADISVSAANEFKYTSWSDNTAETGGVNKTNWSNNQSYTISASTVADNGLSMTSYAGTDGSTDGAFDDYGFTIGGDFGTLGFQGSEFGDAFATAADVTPDEGNSISTTAIDYVLPADESVDNATISYKSPNISGFQFTLGAKPNGNSDSSSVGAQYSMTSGDASITVKYASSAGGKATTGAAEIEATSMGLVVGYGDATVTIAQNTKENGTYDFTGDSIGITYKMSDSMTLSAYTGTTDDAKDSTHEVKDTGLGVAYTITPGLVLNVTHNDWSIKDTSITNEDGSHMAVALNLSF
jgi:hypothetical protein